MKKFSLVLTVLAVAVCFSIAGCAQEKDVNYYELATQYGYTGSAEQFKELCKSLQAVENRGIADITREGGKIIFRLTDGTVYEIDVVAKDGTTGKDGADGKDGVDGADGLTPAIGENGNWWIGDKDTGTPAYDTTVYTVKLNYDRFHISQEIKVKRGSCIDLPTPTAEGYIFAGWYTGGTANDRKFSSYDPVFRDMTLYARWDVDNENYYTDGLLFTFNNDNGYTVRYDIEDSTVIHASNIRETVEKIIIPSYYDDGVHGRLPVKAIKMDAFSNCVSLTDIRIPSTIESIGQYAFSNCRSLKTIAIPDNASVSGDTFSNCPNLETIRVSEEHKFYRTIDGVLYNKNGNILIKYPATLSRNNFTIPESVTVIGSHAFDSAAGLHEITLPQNLTEIRNSAFAGCTNLKSITIPDGISKIDRSTFDRCEQLTSVTLPEGLTEIGSDAFNKCVSLTTVILPQGLSKIGAYAFSNCRSLAQIALPPQITIAEDGVFSRCASLTAVNGIERIEHIGQYAFYGCDNLKIAALSPHLTAIGTYAFSLCNAMDTLLIPESVISIGYHTFDSWKETQTLRFACSEEDSGAWDSEWNKFCNAKIVWNYPANG